MRIKLIVLGLLVIIAIWFFYDASCSDLALRAKRNKSNSENIVKGMTQTDFYRIMGKPDTMINNYVCYITKNDSYPYIEFSFDSNGNVKEIYSPYKKGEKNSKN